MSPETRRKPCTHPVAMLQVVDKWISLLCVCRALLSQVLLRHPGNKRVCLHVHPVFDPRGDS